MKFQAFIPLLGAALIASTAQAADTLPAGTLITGSISGASTSLLGLDHAYAAEPGSNVTALAASDLEYLSGDFALGFDFFTDGTLRVWNNSDSRSLANYSVSFSFAGGSLGGIALGDMSGLNGGTVSVQLLDAHTIGLTFSNLSFADDFGSFTTQISAAVVPEPASYALLGVGLGLLALRRARRHA